METTDTAVEQTTLSTEKPAKVRTKKRMNWKRFGLICLIIVTLPLIALFYLWHFLKWTKLRCWTIILSIVATLSILLYEIARGIKSWTSPVFGAEGFPLWIIILLLFAGFVATAATLTVCIMRSTFRKV